MLQQLLYWFSFWSESGEAQPELCKLQGKHTLIELNNSHTFSNLAGKHTLVALNNSHTLTVSTSSKHILTDLANQHTIGGC